ncbi:MAG: tRNA pseudouridine(55) synthase TruB [Armatimonadetes bacterium]|nr:tRNA pseudouridine(55) synthase TruB [Armatimonadota bacterium]
MNGFLNVLKPPEMTSHDVVAFVRRMLPRGSRVGHLGTLDPLAVGVLPLAVGQATRLIQYLPLARKLYLAEVTLGLASDTLDAGGEVVETGPVEAVSRARVEEVCSRFRGSLMQVPPRVSALRVQGRRGYERARQGEDFELEPRPAVYHEVRLLDFELPVLRLLVDCGPGTYVRSLARDLGRELGTGAILSFLVRLGSGPFQLESSLTLEELLAARRADRLDGCVLSCSKALADLPEVEVARLPGKGSQVTASPRGEVTSAATVRMVDPTGDQAVGAVTAPSPLTVRMLCEIPGAP